jgi:hypothetical protein
MTAPSLHDFIRELDATKTHYTLAWVREGGVMVEVAIPGERWEIEFFDDREPEIEIFRSDGTICAAEKLAELRKIMAD